jgi:transmembrane 9 superfamily protein 2/4
MALLALLASLLTCSTLAFYIPGVAKKEFLKGANIDIFYNKLESTQTHLPFDYNYLSFCDKKHAKEGSQNIGQQMMGEA